MAGNRDHLLAMHASPVSLPRLGEHRDPVADEPWLVAGDDFTHTDITAAL